MATAATIDFDKLTGSAEIIAPTTPIRSVHFLPVLLLTGACMIALVKSQKAKMTITNPIRNAVFALLPPPENCTMKYAYRKMGLQAKASVNLKKP